MLDRSKEASPSGRRGARIYGAAATRANGPWPGQGPRDSLDAVGRFVLAVMVFAIFSGAVVATPALEPGDDAPVPEAPGGVGPGLLETPEREYCTPLGCVGVRTAHWSGVAGFAAAALAAGWLARRHRTSHP
jgi:hypothetical protein